MALLLCQTQGAFLTSIKGIGLVLASGVTSELGNPLHQKSAANLASYSGIIPWVKQSGGTQGQPITGRVSKRSNHILKDYVVQSAFHIGRYGPIDLQTDYKCREASGQHADFGMGRRFIRMAIRLMLTSQIYIPSYLRTQKIEWHQIAGHYLSIWPFLKEKWEKFGALHDAFINDRPMAIYSTGGLWHKITNVICIGH